MSNDQKQLFDIQPQPWNLDDQDDWLAARVAFSDAPYGPYDYSIPSNLESSVRKGVRVRVPLGRGNRMMTGYCVDIIGPAHKLASTVNPARLKDVIGVVDSKPLLSDKLIKLANWISDYYICHLGSVIDAVVPPGVRDNSGTREMLFIGLADGVLQKIEDGEIRVTAKQRLVIDQLAKGGDDWTPRELAETVGCTQAPISTLRRKGLIVSSKRRIQTITHEIPEEARREDLNLNEDQQKALDRICEQIECAEYRTFLMHGITGSGKTEVYIRAIQKVVDQGQQAIVLVPEISLTPQTRQRFRERFDRVAVLHSHLTAAQRAWHWHEIANGRVQVIVGARSAIFAPVPNPGLIVLDEEHDGSFKQDKAPRYHARDVAVQRAQEEGIPLILGSATPSMESWQNSRNGNFDLLSLPSRILDYPLPDVRTIDMRVDFGGRRRSGPISQKLRQEMRRALEEKGQVILLLNRRGFSTRIQCPACGNVEQCPDCSIPLTHHLEGRKVVCHYCDYAKPEPDRCSDCGGAAIRFSGLGTQKLEREVCALFPDYGVQRMDTDTMRKPGSHEKALAAFRAGETQILLGTQMIAKGLDFPNVTLVGVVNADTTLHFPDFRAAERTFGLVTQVAGRSGRGDKGGRVLVQTFSPEAPAIVSATRHDFAGFAEGDLPEREALGYPPFGHMARVVVRSESKTAAEQMSEHIGEQIGLSGDALNLPVDILGPAPAPVEKLRGKFRFHLQLLSPEQGALQEVVRRAQTTIKAQENVQWIVDIDPQDML
ncbi:MAG: primosomal protein N' [Planctomycetota bacterium]